MADPNTLRRLNWLWKHRHKNHDDITSRLTIIEKRDEEESASDGGGAGGPWTVSVAASNARPEVKAVATFVCDGVDDHLDIVAACTLLTFLPAGTGRIELSEGDFTDMDLDVIVVPAGSMLIGLGENTSRLEFNGTDGVAIELGFGATARDFSYQTGGVAL
jgi:hypothetical protein